MAFKRRINLRENGGPELHDAGTEASRRAELAELLKSRHRNFKRIITYSGIAASAAGYETVAHKSLIFGGITDVLLIVTIASAAAMAYTKHKIKKLKESKRK